jgi:hypothetical protein
MRQPEEVKRDLVRQWLAKADEDLNAAKALFAKKYNSLSENCR